MLISNNIRFCTDVFGEKIAVGNDTMQGGSGGDTTQGGSGGDTTQGGSGGSTFALTKSARLEAKTPLDASSVSAVNGFIVSGTQPTNTSRRFLFKIDGTLYKFLNGSLTAYSGSGTLDNMLKWGNTAAELTALTDIPGFVGKKIYPIIALSAPYDSDFPTVKLQLKTRTNADTLSKWFYSATYNLDGDNPVIADVNADFVVEEQGSVFVNCKLTQNGQDTDWLNLNQAANQHASAIKFRALLKVVNIGTDSATLNDISIRYTANNVAVSGDTTEIFSILNDFEAPLQTCYLIVKHKRLIDSAIDAYVSFRPKSKYRERIALGVANGSRTSYSLPDSQIDHASLQVFVDGEVWNDFDYNLEVNEITLNAPRDSALAVSYTYDIGTEEWLPMTKQGDQQPYTGTDFYMTRFALATSLDNFSNAVVRIKLTRTAGHVQYQSLGNATGFVQQIVTPHIMATDSLHMNYGVDWSYDADNKILTYVATAGKAVGYWGDWLGEQQSLYGFTAGFSL